MHSVQQRKSRPVAGGTGTSHRGGRPRRRYRALLLGGVVVVGLLGSLLVFRNGGDGKASSTSSRPAGETRVAVPPKVPGAPGAPAGSSSSSSGDFVATPRAISPTPTAPDTAPAGSTPETGTGDFTTARANGKSVGSGTVRRYKVQVEGGTGVSATSAAREIQRILGDPRGWTADGHDAFQLVSSGSYDFEVKIATPVTVDAICGAAGLHTHGEVNCDVGDQVIVNLKRWNTGSPEFPGPIDQYRALIINHEVGHRIGHGHEGCPGPGKPAPAMMQQIDGLHGCVANAWPYDSHGHYLAGPPAP
ncbi:DUF3152 domain-containing protein [Streptomyces sp. NBC_01190]|uniref:DUF3152 domain-containing protein n=1 Tax=Streptomyces sp. NBC_01190 TaxID=2903767 RepID=UPI003866F7F2|nr:DUF3152 domain-containing protein [Streptomyces sp. NBC_01190]